MLWVEQQEGDMYCVKDTMDMSGTAGEKYTAEQLKSFVLQGLEIHGVNVDKLTGVTQITPFGTLGAVRGKWYTRALALGHKITYSTAPDKNLVYAPATIADRTVIAAVYGGEFEENSFDHEVRLSKMPKKVEPWCEALFIDYMNEYGFWDFPTPDVSAVMPSRGTITIPDGIKIVGNFLNEDNLVSETFLGSDCTHYENVAIVLPDSVEILVETFNSICFDVGSHIFSKNLKNIGEDAFMCCDFGNVDEVLPNGVWWIHIQAFYGSQNVCEILKNLPNSIDYIGDSAFAMSSIDVRDPCVDICSFTSYMFWETDEHRERYERDLREMYEASEGWLSRIELPSGRLTVCAGAFYGVKCQKYVYNGDSLFVDIGCFGSPNGVVSELHVRKGAIRVMSSSIERVERTQGKLDWESAEVLSKFVGARVVFI